MIVYRLTDSTRNKLLVFDTPRVAINTFSRWLEAGGTPLCERLDIPVTKRNMMKVLEGKDDIYVSRETWHYDGYWNPPT